MTTPSKTKSCFKQVLLKIDARSLCKNNQQVGIDYLKSRSNKNKFESKKCGCTEFYELDYQNSSFAILPIL